MKTKEELEWKEEFEKEMNLLDTMAETFDIDVAVWTLQRPDDFNDIVATGLFSVEIMDKEYAVEDPTFLDIWRIADLYNMEHDLHHIFIENFVVNYSEENIQIFMGS